VVDHVGELIRKQPDVDRVEHGSHRRNGEICLHVPLVVPHERSDTVTFGDTEPGECCRQPISPVCDLRKGGLGDLGIQPLIGENLRSRMNRPSMPQQMGDGEREVGHRAVDHRERFSPQIDSDSNGLSAKCQALVLFRDSGMVRSMATVSRVIAPHPRQKLRRKPELVVVTQSWFSQSDFLRVSRLMFLSLNRSRSMGPGRDGFILGDPE
jgi:hypothetical protein